MSQIQRLRPDRSNPNRYQGSLRHYHLAPAKEQIPWEHWIGGKKRRGRGLFWLGLLAFLVAILATAAALMR